MPKYTRTKMCHECPFRAAAAPGWLGPWKAEELEQVAHSDAELICHRAVDQLKDAGKSDAQIKQTGQHCVGVLRYRSSLFKLSRDPSAAEARRRLRRIDDQPLIAPHQFVAHHTNKEAHWGAPSRVVALTHTQEEVTDEHEER